MIPTRPLHVAPLAAFRNLTALLTHPAPQSAAESEQLRNHAQRSFRRQLQKSSQDPTTPAQFSADNPCSEHLNSVLRIPAFAASASEAGERQKKRLQLLMDNPLTAFEEHVSTGTASLALATACMVRLHQFQKEGRPNAEDCERLLGGMVKAGLLATPGEVISLTERVSEETPHMIVVRQLRKMIVAVLRKGGEREQMLLGQWLIEQKASNRVLLRFLTEILEKDGAERAAGVLCVMIDTFTARPGPDGALLPSVLRQKCWEASRDALMGKVLYTTPLQNLFSRYKSWATTPFADAWMGLRLQKMVEPALDVAKSKLYLWGPNKIATPATILRFLHELKAECLRQNRDEDARRISVLVKECGGRTHQERYVLG